ncbi:hypothetical protein EAE96_010309 [Botrytis aclada]|nr:hypothetical protein EAE96_010309 [Botrytis aclada]
MSGAPRSDHHSKEDALCFVDCEAGSALPPSPIIVTWENETDRENPQNFSEQQKWMNVILISCQGTLTTTCSTLLAISSLDIAATFSLASSYGPGLPLGFYILGLGLGPLYLAPLSEIYGRRHVYLAAFSAFTILNIGCALSPNVASLTILRFLSGIAGSAGPTLGGSSIGDMFSKRTRGKAQAIYNFGPTGGPALGGIIGGFVAYETGNWRWLMWIMVIAPAVLVILSYILLKETYAPRLLYLKAERLRKENPTTLYVCEYQKVDTKALFARAITRPVRMLLRSPICTALSIYIALIYGILFLHLITLILLFGPISSYGLYTYGWTQGTAGLAYLGVGIGNIIGTFVAIVYMNRTYAFITNRHREEMGTEAPPEARLLLLKFSMIILPIGLIIFAWSAQYRVHWAVPLLGAAIFSTGSILGFVCIQVYLVDIFGNFAASALATTILLRSIVGCIFSIVGFKLYVSLGYGWGTTLLALICASMIPIPFLLDHYGPKLRAKRITF